MRWRCPKTKGDVEQSVSIYEVLADVAYKKGNYQQAFVYQQRFFRIKRLFIGRKQGVELG